MFPTPRGSTDQTKTIVCATQHMTRQETHKPIPNLILLVLRLAQRPPETGHSLQNGCVGSGRGVGLSRRAVRLVLGLAELVVSLSSIASVATICLAVSVVIVVVGTVGRRLAAELKPGSDPRLIGYTHYDEWH